jgi:hypothetical protein
MRSGQCLKTQQRVCRAALARDPDHGTGGRLTGLVGHMANGRRYLWVTARR